MKTLIALIVAMAGVSCTSMDSSTHAIALVTASEATDAVKVESVKAIAALGRTHRHIQFCGKQAWYWPSGQQMWAVNNDEVPLKLIASAEKVGLGWIVSDTIKDVYGQTAMVSKARIGARSAKDIQRLKNAAAVDQYRHAENMFKMEMPIAPVAP